MNPTYAFDQQTTGGKTKADFLNLKPGATVKVHQKIKEGDKFRIQIFEGIIIARKHGVGPSATVIVRKVSDGIGVERTFPLHSPMVAQFEVMKASKVRQSKLYYLREKTARETRKKTKSIALKSQPKASAPEVATQ